MAMLHKIRLMILEDHQSVIDGYMFRLSQVPDIEVVATAMYAEEVEPLLVKTSPVVLILDVSVPTSPGNPNPYPILHEIPRWLQAHPKLHVLVISMLNQRRLVKAVMAAGASGFILKDDQKAILELGSILRLVATGGIFLSEKVRCYLTKQDDEENSLSPRQLETLALMAAYPDAPANELAARLGVSQSTLRNFLSEAYLKLGVHGKTAALAKAMQLGLITPSTPFTDL